MKRLIPLAFGVLALVAFAMVQHASGFAGENPVGQAATAMPMPVPAMTPIPTLTPLPMVTPMPMGTSMPSGAQ
ncbi:MAG TPA: hypothetical protein VMA36_10870 [Candidatus Limnocylindria bacterium]|jgi:hypothetical protein|nr:hypothetical protein [Candidatus Limnocylindria bacterium]